MMKIKYIRVRARIEIYRTKRERYPLKMAEIYI